MSLLLARNKETTPIEEIARRDLRVLRTAGWHTVDGNDIRPRSGFIWTQQRAITARINQNYDAWPSEELKKTAHLWLGKPVFVNHNNFDPKKARGKVIAARYLENGDDKYIETIMEVDAQRFPKLAHELRTGGLDGVSMGVEAGFTKCSICGNKACDTEDMCSHVKYRKGEYLPHVKTGKRTLCYENCYKLSWFELSYVFDPADETAVVSKVLVASRRQADCPPDCGPSGPSAEASGNGANALNQPKSMPTDSSHNQFNSGGSGGYNTSFSEGGPITSPTSHSGGGYSGGGSGGGGSSGGGGNSSGGAPGKPDGSGILPNARPLYDQLEKEFPGANIGGYRVDDYHEHDHGAMDFMTNDPNQAAKVRADAFAAGAPYVLYQQQQWNADGSRTPMENRGSPTQNHMDHVHIAPFTPKPSPTPAPTAAPTPAKTSRRQGRFLPPTKTADKLRGTDWHALGRQSFAEGGPEQPHQHHEVVRATRHLDPRSPEARHVHEAYERGYTSAAQEQYARVPKPEPESVGLGGYPGGHQWHQRKKVASKGSYRGGGPERKTTGYRLDVGRSGPPSPSLHRSHLWGKPEAPDPVNTLAPDDVDRMSNELEEEKNPNGIQHFGHETENPFKNTVDSPDELQDPDLDESKRRIRKEQQMSRKRGRRYYAADDIEEDYDESPPDDDSDDGGDFSEGAPEFDDGGGEAPPDVAEDLSGPDEDVVVDFLYFCESSGVDPSPETVDQYAQAAGIADEATYQGLQQFVAEFFGGAAGPEGPPAEEAPPGPPVDDSAPDEFDENDMGQGPPVSLASRKGSPMGNSSLAQRGRVASAGRRRHFQADDNGHTDGGPYGRNDQGEQENVFLSETPSPEAVEAPSDDESNISNTENTLVARVVHGTEQLKRDTARLQQFRSAYRYAADGGLPDATTVNPSLSGTTDGDEYKGDFEAVQPTKTETQPKDASLHAFAAFDNWLRETTGRTAAQHNASFIRRQASRWANSQGIPVAMMFPTLEFVLRQARKAERGDSMYRTADEKLEVAAPDARVDTEAPVSDVTDAEAQASQFDLGDFGQNAGDGSADPDLDTGSQIWAPGEGQKTSKKADAVAAVRCAEAYIKAGLTPEDEKWKLIASFQTMRHATVVDRTRLLEAVIQASRQRVAATRPRNAIPAGFASGGRGRTASVSRTAANDPSNDCTLFV